MHLCQQGHLVASPSPITSLRSQTEIAIVWIRTTLLAVERKNNNVENGVKALSIADGLVWPLLIRESVHCLHPSMLMHLFVLCTMIGSAKVILRTIANHFDSIIDSVITL